MSVSITPIKDLNHFIGDSGISGRHHVGLEFLNKTCWVPKCKKQLFALTGYVTVNAETSHQSRSDWESDNWIIKDLYALYQCDDHIALQVAYSVSEIAKNAADGLQKRKMQMPYIEKRYIKKADLTLWTNVCPSCGMHDGPALLLQERNRLIDKQRVGDETRKTLMIYRGIYLDIQHLALSCNQIKAQHSTLPD